MAQVEVLSWSARAIRAVMLTRYQDLLEEL